MNLQYSKYLIILGFLVLFSCKNNSVEPDVPVIVIQPDPEPEKPVEPAKPQYLEENSWIYAQMKLNYLWAETMPLEDSTDKNLVPIEYFNSLINKENDRFSYMKNRYDEILDYWNGNLKSFGFRYRKFSNDGSTLSLAVSLALKGSPAEKAGLGRGDVITKINGNVITTSNVEDLLATENSVFTVSDSIGQSRNVTIIKEKFQIDPLQFYKIYEVGGKKIGYLVYTQFLFNYETETREIFKYFKEQRIDDMIIDLRFNPGGVTPIAEVMASLLGPDLGTSTVLFKGYGNAYQSSTSTEPPFRTFTNETSNLSNLSRIFAITSNSSSSSSELIINCLRPYRPVYTVGGHTYGKNVISTILRDENSKFSFALMPAWSVIQNVNGQSDYGNKNGIGPDYPVADGSLPYKALGDPEETLLKAAISVILGKTAGLNNGRTNSYGSLLDDFHNFDTGTGFLGNKRYN